jgi:hypothetical protein
VKQANVVALLALIKGIQLAAAFARVKAFGFSMRVSRLDNVALKHSNTSRSMTRVNVDVRDGDVVNAWIA